MYKYNAIFISLIFIILIGLYFFLESLTILASTNDPIGPGYLPFWLSIILFVLCGFSIVKTYIEKSKYKEKITVPNFRLILYTILIMIGFYLSWQYLGLLYLFSFIFVLVLLTLYKNRNNRWNLKNVSINSVISGGFTSILYVLFNVILQLNL